MEPFRLCVALLPLALYLAALAAINLRRRALVVGGGRDTAALCVGVSGLVLVGPVELLFPRDAVLRLGPVLYWSLLATLYFLGAALVALMARPRLVIYNATIDQIRPLLADVAAKLDSSVRWAGNSLYLPSMHVELHMEANSGFRSLSLVASSDEQSFGGWRALEAALAARLATERMRRNSFGLVLALAAAAMLARVGWDIIVRPELVAAGFRELMQM